MSCLDMLDSFGRLISCLRAIGIFSSSFVLPAVTADYCSRGFHDKAIVTQNMFFFSWWFSVVYKELLGTLFCLWGSGICALCGMAVNRGWEKEKVGTKFSQIYIYLYTSIYTCTCSGALIWKYVRTNIYRFSHFVSTYMTCFCRLAR